MMAKVAQNGAGRSAEGHKGTPKAAKMISKGLKQGLRKTRVLGDVQHTGLFQALGPLVGTILSSQGAFRRQGGAR